MAVHSRLIFAFDDFQLEPEERRVTHRGEVVPLHGKAFELLLALVRNHGRLLSKNEIFELVWPDQLADRDAALTILRERLLALNPDR